MWLSADAALLEATSMGVAHRRCRSRAPVDHLPTGCVAGAHAPMCDTTAPLRLHACVPVCRFVAQRLRLAARAVPHSQKLAFVAREHVCSAAIKDATAQEAALYKRAANKQVRGQRAHVSMITTAASPIVM
jgi:hypothetical protein